MLEPLDAIAAEAARLAGDPAALAEQLGPVADLGTLHLPAVSPFGQVTSVGALRRFLEQYQAQVLVPVDLPAIHRAFDHASRNELRELIALDQELRAQPALREFAAASGVVGRAQLRRLLPLRGLRLVRRYFEAVERGEARGWHTLVYGLMLSLYSLPLRQGLVGYGRQTLYGFIQAAAGPLALTEVESRKLLEECLPVLREGMERALGPRVGLALPDQPG